MCAALCKGASRSDDIQAFVAAWHAMTAALRCRVYLVWVPSRANPADEVSRDDISRVVSDDEVRRLRLPKWAARQPAKPLQDIVKSATAAALAKLRGQR